MIEEWPLTAEWENVHPLYKKQINKQTNKKTPKTLCSWNAKHVKNDLHFFWKDGIFFKLFCLCCLCGYCYVCFLFLPGVGWLWTTWVAGFGVREVQFTPFSAGVGLGSLLASDGASPWSTWKYEMIYITLSN